MGGNHTSQNHESNRIAKCCTSQNVRLPKRQLATEMLGTAIRLFSRVELLRQVHGERFMAIYRATQLPLCFARRNPLADELDRLDALSGEPTLFSFGCESKESRVPTFVSTNLTSDACPPDLYASAYEVRYLSIEEMAMVALRCLAREHLTNEQLEQSRTETQRKNDEAAKCDADLFALSADAPAVDKSGWQETAKRRFDDAMRAAGLSATLARPYDNRPVIATAIETMHVEEPFAKPQANFYLAKVWSQRRSDTHASSTFVPDGTNARLYDADVRFEFSYLHAKTMDRGSKPHATRATNIPAQLFAAEFDDPSSVAVSTHDPDEIDSLLRSRLAAALARFGRPIGGKSDMMALFGTKKRLDRFNALMEWRSKAFAAISNQRAVSAALLDALHLQLDVIERAMRDSVYRESTYDAVLRHWATADSTRLYRLHPHLLQFVKGADTNYADWECDFRSAINDRYAREMLEPFTCGSLFYSNCFFPALRDAENGVYCDVLPINQSADASALERSFAECWNGEMCATYSSLLQSRTRQVHRWPTDDLSVRTLDDGHVIRGFVLMLECEPVGCTDSSNENDYGELYRYSKRNLTLNPFYQFFEALLNYLLGSDATRERSRAAWPEISVYADITLASACMMDQVMHMYRAINNKDVVDPALAESLSAKLDRAVQEKSWRSTAAALLIDSPRTNDRLTKAWQTAISCFHRAAAYDRTQTASERPFSTLYDFGAHSYKVIEECKALEQKKQHKEQQRHEEQRHEQRDRRPTNDAAADENSTLITIPASLLSARRAPVAAAAAVSQHNNNDDDDDNNDNSELQDGNSLTPTCSESEYEPPPTPQPTQSPPRDESCFVRRSTRDCRPKKQLGGCRGLRRRRPLLFGVLDADAKRERRSEYTQREKMLLELTSGLSDRAEMIEH